MSHSLFRSAAPIDGMVDQADQHAAAYPLYAIAFGEKASNRKIPDMARTPLEKMSILLIFNSFWRLIKWPPREGPSAACTFLQGANQD
jgi:hypothetical protein